MLGIKADRQWIILIIGQVIAADGSVIHKEEKDVKKIQDYFICYCCFYTNYYMWVSEGKGCFFPFKRKSGL